MYRKYIISLLAVVFISLAWSYGKLEAANFDLERATFWGKVDDIEIYYEDEWVDESWDQKSWRKCGVKVYEKNLTEPWQSHTYVVKGLYKPQERAIYSIEDYGTVLEDKYHQRNVEVEGTGVDWYGYVVCGTNGRDWIIPRLLKKINGQDVAMPESLQRKKSRWPSAGFRDEYKFVASYENVGLYCRPRNYVKPYIGNGNTEEFTSEWYVEPPENPLKSILLRSTWRYTGAGKMYYKIEQIGAVEGEQNKKIIGWQEVYPDAYLQEAVSALPGEDGSEIEKFIGMQKKIVETLKRAELLFNKGKGDQESNWG